MMISVERSEDLELLSSGLVLLLLPWWILSLEDRRHELPIKDRDFDSLCSSSNETVYR